jgi:hypothetical protein
MRLLRFVAFTSCLLCTFLNVAHGQLTRSGAEVIYAVTDVLCKHDVQSAKPTVATCSGGINNQTGSATGTAIGESNYSALTIYASSSATPQNGYTLYMNSQVGAEVEDDLIIGNYPTGSTLFFAYSLLAVPGGQALGTVELVVTISSANQNSCNIQAFGHNSCSAQVAVASNGVAHLQALLLGQAGVMCGPPNCGASLSSLNAGYKEPGGGKPLIIRVLDSSGNPVKGATITSVSGHKYPTLFASTTTLTSNPNPSANGEPVTFTATIASFGRSGTPTGKVTFTDSTTGTALGKVTLSGGVASLTTSALASGMHVITASYGGDDWSASSKSNVTQTVN